MHFIEVVPQPPGSHHIWYITTHVEVRPPKRVRGFYVFYCMPRYSEGSKRPHASLQASFSTSVLRC